MRTKPPGFAWQSWSMPDEKMDLAPISRNPRRFGLGKEILQLQEPNVFWHETVCTGITVYEVRSWGANAASKAEEGQWLTCGMIQAYLPKKTQPQHDSERTLRTGLLKAQRLRLGLPEHAQSGTDNQKKAWCHLLPGPEGPALSRPPDCSHRL